jgi:stearoyl-CoA desaturase (delta-9 desaturase)
VKPEHRFEDYLPTWKTLDRIGDSWYWRIVAGAGYTVFYIFFATHWWMFLLLPIHYLMGPIQGALVNWCGHKYGYSNFNNGDQSKNTGPWGVMMLGELFQNNHHKFPNSAKFARRWFEFDPTYYIMVVMHWLHIIRFAR